MGHYRQHLCQFVSILLFLLFFRYMITWPPKKRLSLIGFLIQKLAKQWTVGWLRTQALNYPCINHWVWAPWFLRSCHNFFFRSSSVSVNDAGPQLVILCGSLWPKREGQKKRDEKITARCTDKPIAGVPLFFCRVRENICARGVKLILYSLVWAWLC